MRIKGNYSRYENTTVRPTLYAHLKKCSKEILEYKPEDCISATHKSYNLKVGALLKSMLSLRRNLKP